MIAALVLAVLVATAIGTALMRKYALARDMLDVPNARSSHAVPTPRGGGVAFVAVICVATAIFGMTTAKASAAPVWAAWLFGGILVAGVGFVDDRRGLTARSRLVAHAVAALPLVAHTGLPTVTIAGGTFDLGWTGAVIAWLAVIWSVNAFNFMDGIDGIASGQAVFVFGAAAALAAIAGGTPATVGVLAVCAAGAAGFLLWNFPPAKIFMGDAGSGFLGYAVATLALVSATESGPSLWVWTILHTLFIADATVTLVTRAATRQPLHLPHRSHVYQRLSQRWNSHGKVLATYMGINLLVLLPIAAAGVLFPDAAPALAGSALVVAACCVMVLGGGRPRTDAAGASV